MIGWHIAKCYVPMGMVQSERVLHLLSLRNMTVFSWHQGLEDEFDGKNRMNLRHFIRQKQTEITLDDGSSIDSDEVTYYITKKSSGLTIEHEKLAVNLWKLHAFHHVPFSTRLLLATVSRIHIYW